VQAEQEINSSDFKWRVAQTCTRGLVALGYKTRQLFYIQLHRLLHLAIKIIKNPDNSKLKRSLSMQGEKIWKKTRLRSKIDKVNSSYSGHPRDRDLVSVIAGCAKIFILNDIYRRGSHVCSFSLIPVPFSDPLSHVKSVRTLFTNRNRT